MEIEEPFYDKSVYDKLELLKIFIAKNSFADIRKWDSKHVNEFWTKEPIFKKETREIVEVISESIRKRISSIEAV